MKYCYLFFNLLILLGCSSPKGEPVKTIDEATKIVRESFVDSVEVLMISDELNDEMGAHMAIIGDAVLKKGYMPNGFEQKNGYRIYRYRKF